MFPIKINTGSSNQIIRTTKQLKKFLKRSGCHPTHLHQKTGADDIPEFYYYDKPVGDNSTTLADILRQN